MGGAMRTLLLVLPLLLLAPSAGAQEHVLNNLLHARSFAMGGAYSTLGLGAEAVVGNPAAMSLYRRYLLEASGAWDFQDKDAFATFAVLDSQTSRLAAGLTYDLVSFGRGDERRTAHLSTFAFALPLMEFLHAGASARYLAMSGAESANAVTMDAGLVVRLVEGLHLGASGHNLIDIHHPELPRYYVFSGALVGHIFSIAADVRADFESGPSTQLIYSAGGEIVLGAGIPLRAGYRYEALTGEHSVSGGLGLFAEGGGIDLAYLQSLNGPGKLIALTFRIQR